MYWILIPICLCNPYEFVLLRMIILFGWRERVRLCRFVKQRLHKCRLYHLEYDDFDVSGGYGQRARKPGGMERRGRLSYSSDVTRGLGPLTYHSQF
jgi:hypothetical protein